VVSCALLRYNIVIILIPLAVFYESDSVKPKTDVHAEVVAVGMRETSVSCAPVGVDYSVRHIDTTSYTINHYRRCAAARSGQE